MGHRRTRNNFGTEGTDGKKSKKREHPQRIKEDVCGQFLLYK